MVLDAMNSTDPNLAAAKTKMANYYAADEADREKQENDENIAILTEYAASAKDPALKKEMEDQIRALQALNVEGLPSEGI